MRAEFARSFRPPFEVPLTVLANGLLLVVCWFLLPEAWRDWFFNRDGPLAFPVILAIWMYSDVPSTNVLAPDRTRIAAALGDATMLRRLLHAKNAVLWLLVTPPRALAALTFGFGDVHPRRIVLTVVLVATAPLGALGLSAWVGIRFPYHPLPLRRRWRLRRPWRHMILRWLALATTPYLLFPLVCSVLVTPAFFLRTMGLRRGMGPRAVAASFTLGVFVAAALATVTWVVAHRAGVWLAQQRRRELSAYLADPDLG